MDDWLLVTFWLFLVVPSQAVTRCINAPSPAKRIFCEQLHRWHLGTRKSRTFSEVPSESRTCSTYDDSAIKEIDPYQCRDLRCLCRYMKGEWHPCEKVCALPNGQILVKSYRREYRTLGNEERRRLHSAFRTLKQNGQFDKLATIHAQHSQSGAAHSGPAFLPWHRELLKRLEIAIRLIDPELSLPYWDSTLDSHLQAPEESILWSDELMGSTDENGTVQGEFAGWKVPQGRRMLRRDVGSIGQPLNDDDIYHIVTTTKVDDILAFTAPRKGCVYPSNYNALEYAQGSVQVFVGGDMKDLATAANDPAFFLHQAFIDFLWEQWRHTTQNEHDRDMAYPPDLDLCSSPAHFSHAFMRPFEPLLNMDGLHGSYTDSFYDYAPRPTCRESCGSKYLFCDHSRLPSRCVSKVRPGGNCAGFYRSEEVCFRGRCIDNICIPDTIRFSPKPITPHIVNLPPPSYTPKIRTLILSNFVTRTATPTKLRSLVSAAANKKKTSLVVPKAQICHNEHECCAVWSAKGECDRNKPYMHAWCRASCAICKPSFNITHECADFHVKCSQWGKSGECWKNPLWMTENCRKSCQRCDRTRAQVCSDANRRNSLKHTEM